ncbi:mycofactocin biosynthesis glycosyltransferase MftF [Leifsonia sp. NPDC080035]|uniref:Mycofactocin biosynthesis glycosyltransferase MftF n=1 Tax=Leifsonia sp. NPDC080035 TaxID=3143936 RepID=A0AAU7G7Z4_9MICO
MTGLPDGAVVELRRDVRVSDAGRTLIGGAPTRALYLTEAAVGLLVDRRLTVSSAASRRLATLLLDAGIAEPVLDSLPKSAAGPGDVTVVIPVYGRTPGLERLLASIPEGHPIVVVDDASPDPAPIAEAAERYGAAVVVLPDNRGPGGARNAGLAEVRTEFVAFADSDVVIDDTVIPALLKHFVDPAVSVVAPRVLGLVDGDETNWIGRYEAARSSLDLGAVGGSVRPRSPIAWAPAAFLLARVADLGAAFTPGVRKGEDVDLVWRLVSEGRRIRYEPLVVVRHEHRTTVRTWLGRKLEYGSSATGLAKRHGSLVAPAILAPWSTVFILGLLLQRRWSIVLAGGSVVFAWLRIARRLGRGSHPYRDAARLTAKGVGSTVWQTVALILRHWWPLAAVAAILSRRARRAVAAAVVLDAAVEYGRVRPRLDPIRFALARRLDDIAHGYGIWKSVVTERSARALLPHFVRSTRATSAIRTQKS